jgi:hypothetical protein
MLENLAEITAVDPAMARRTPNEVLGFIPSRITGAPSNVFAARERHCCGGAGNTVSWPVCRSLTATMPSGF